ncbi:DgyrCDS3048 [Dimorphilus gyrociliatus]|uniref:Zinc finger protein 143 n=1 Tax=Dimorphilus gyrociliatus TaxID=2664684 RepID=A0A7I8VDT3_9ANNE|nr:DgyrCDS3048 [Dimorphilus gyrociliatus]
MDYLKEETEISVEDKIEIENNIDEQVTVQPLTIQGAHIVSSLPPMKIHAKDLAKLNQIPTIHLSDGSGNTFGLLEAGSLTDTQSFLSTSDSNSLLGINLDGEVLSLNTDSTEYNPQYDTVRILSTSDKSETSNQISTTASQAPPMIQQKTVPIPAISKVDSHTSSSSPKKSQTSEKMYKCPFPNCNRLYSAPHHLKVHERIHTGDKPYRCTYEDCLKSFATSYALKSHLRVHTGEKPYKCSFDSCSKAFKTSGDLQKHTRTHTGERPFKCPFEDCNRSFTTSNIRKVHIRTHTGERPYVCTEENCGRAFASATNYKNHMRIHTGEKPYVCHVPDCGKKFTEYSSLFKHNVVHTQQKPYACHDCGKTYRQTSTLAMHKRTAHNDEGPISMQTYMIDELVNSGKKSPPPKADKEQNSTKAVVPNISFLSAEQAAEAVAAGGAFLVTQTPSASNIHPVFVRVPSDNGNEQYKQVQTADSTQIIMVSDPSHIGVLQDDDSGMVEEDGQVELQMVSGEDVGVLSENEVN